MNIEEEKSLSEELKLHNDVISKFNNELYKNIFTEENLVSTKKAIMIDDQKWYGYFLEKDKERFFVRSEDITKLPFKIKNFKERDYKGDVFKFVENVESIIIPAEKRLEYRELINKLTQFKHTNPLHYKLSNILVSVAYCDRINARVSTVAGFGKDSAVNILAQLVGSISNIYGATFAKLEFCLTNKLLLFNEMGNLKDEDKHNMQEFLLQTGAYFNDYTKRTRKCYDEKTRVLTKEGFKYHKDVKKNEEIMIINPITRETSWSKPKGLFETYIEKECMMKFKSSSGLNMCITPEHKVWCSTNKNSGWKEGKAKDFYNHKRMFLNHSTLWEGTEIKEISLLPSITSSNIDNFIELLGWIITEGSIKHNKCFVSITQNKGNNQIHIKKLLDIMKLEYNEHNYGKTLRYYIKSRELWNWLYDNVGDDCSNKRIPYIFKNSSKRQLILLLNTLISGDGNRRKLSWYYFSKSRQLAEDVLEICIKLSYNAFIVEEMGGYKVRISTRMGETYKYVNIDTNVRTVEYSGNIYCFETKTGYYLTERNGRISLEGNTSTTQEMYNISKTSLLIFYNLPEYYMGKNQEYFDQMFTKAVINRFIPFVFDGVITTNFGQVFDVDKVMGEHIQDYKDIIATLNYYRQNPIKEIKYIVDKSIVFSDEFKRYERTFYVILKWISELSLDQEEFDLLSKELFRAYKSYGKLLVKEKEMR